TGEETGATSGTQTASPPPTRGLSWPWGRDVCSDPPDARAVIAVPPDSRAAGRPSGIDRDGSGDAETSELGVGNFLIDAATSGSGNIVARIRCTSRLLFPAAALNSLSRFSRVKCGPSRRSVPRFKRP